MNLIINSYSLVLLVSGMITLLVAFLIFQKLGKAARWIGFVMLVTAWWAVTYSFELMSQTLRQMQFWTSLEYIGIVLLPVSWIVFIGKEQWLTKRNLALILQFQLLHCFLYGRTHCIAFTILKHGLIKADRFR